MNEQPILTDAAIEAMLARRAGPAAPAGLAESIGAALPAMPAERRPWWSILAPPAGRASALRLAWVVAVVGLLLAATVSAFFVGSELLRRPSQLTVVPPSTVLPVPSAAAPSVAPTAAPAYVSLRPLDRINDLAFAADGTLWLATGAGVLHWDLAAGSATLYGQNEGLGSTAALHVAVAPDGHVWAGGVDWLARFDGSWTAFTEFGAAGRVMELGGLAFGRDGTLAIAARPRDGSPPYLLRYDGRWSATAIAGAEDGAIQAGCGRIDVAADGTVWVNTCSSGVLAFDGSRWTRHDTVATGLPAEPMLAGVAPDGTVWVVMPAVCESETACSNPGHGVARFDGTGWWVYGTTAGVPLSADVRVGPDGSVWAMDGSSVSRFDGTRWINAEVPDLARAYPLAVASDGALWLGSTDGLLRYDGTTVTRHALPAVETERDLPPLKLPLASGPTVTPSALGTITWRAYESSSEYYLRAVGTAHGPVAIDGSDLRWLTPSGAWEGTTLPMEAWRAAAAGDDIIVLGWGRAMRFSWVESRWAPGAALDLPASLGFVYQVAAGPRGTVVAGATSVAWSRDGRHFAEAGRGPGAPRSETSGADAMNTVSIGPVFATRDGFVALVPSHSVTWGGPFPEPVPWFSADGSTWDPVASESPFGTGESVSDVAARDGRYVAIGPDGAVWLSDDGLSWERLPPLESPGEACEPAGCTPLLVEVAAADSGWMILSRDGAAWTSSDGRTWEPLRGWPRVRGGWATPNLALGRGAIVVTGLAVDRTPGAGPPSAKIAVGTIEP